MSFHRFKLILACLIIGFLLMPMSASASYCGDGGLNENEECDDGNFINRDGCSAYCEIEDMEPPTVESVSISNLSTEISTLTNSFNVVFSEAIDPASLNQFNVLFEYNAVPMDIEWDLSDNQKTLNIRINEELFSESRHATHIRNIRDIAGNVMEGEYISTFDTAVAIDYTAPTIKVTPPGGAYNFAQSVKLEAYIDEYTGSDENIDETATIYYTLNDLEINENSPVFTNSISIREGTTLRYFSVDGEGNKTDVFTERYSLTCPEFKNAKDAINKYPECKILECNYGFILKGNTCVVRMGGDDDDYRINAITAPLFSSSTPMTITTKPAIYITKEHHGIIPRPIIFKELKRGIIIQFERDTKIIRPDGKPFYGYIKPPNNLYSKDYPINFGYTFRSIFEFKDAEGNDLQFDPPYKITIPYTDAFDVNEEVVVFTYDSVTDKYSEYNRGLYDADLSKKEVTISSYRTGRFFVAQSGKNFNKSVFNDITTHWGKNYIEALYRKGIVKGRSKGVFAPNENLTRAEFTKVILNAIGAEADDPDEIEDSPFTDVHLYSWYLPYVKKAKDLGLISGYSDGTFRPEQFLNRAEAVKMIISAFKFDLIRPISESVDNQRRYSDLKSNQWYFPYVDFVIQQGIMQGTQKNRNLYKFHPGNLITRAEMAKLAIKTIELAEELDNQ